MSQGLHDEKRRQPADGENKTTNGRQVVVGMSVATERACSTSLTEHTKEVLRTGTNEMRRVNGSTALRLR